MIEYNGEQHMVLLLGKSEIESVLTMKDTIDAVERGFKEYALGTVSMPQRPVIRIEENEQHKGSMVFMPAYLSGMKALGEKVASVFPKNPSRHGLPTILGVVLLNDPETGDLLAIMEGASVTAMRTGAAGGVAAKYLARKDSETVGLFGAGVQARTQLQAVAEVRKVKKVKVFDVSTNQAKRFCDEMGRKLAMNVFSAKSPEDAVKGCDIVITATTAQQPVFNGEWLEEGTHVNGIGSHHGPGVKEIDESTVRRSKVVVDSKEACLAEAGDIIDPIKSGAITSNHIYAELGEIILGNKRGRENSSEITFFKSVGLALQDVSTAAMIYQLARKVHVGREITIK